MAAVLKPAVKLFYARVPRPGVHTYSSRLRARNYSMIGLSEGNGTRIKPMIKCAHWTAGECTSLILDCKLY